MKSEKYPRFQNIRAPNPNVSTDLAHFRRYLLSHSKRRLRVDSIRGRGSSRGHRPCIFGNFGSTDASSTDTTSLVAIVKHKIKCRVPVDLGNRPGIKLLPLELWSMEVSTRYPQSAAYNLPLTTTRPHPTNHPSRSNPTTCPPYLANLSRDLLSHGKCRISALSLRGGGRDALIAGATTCWEPDATNRNRALLVPIFERQVLRSRSDYGVGESVAAESSMYQNQAPKSYVSTIIIDPRNLSLVAGRVGGPSKQSVSPTA